MAATKPYTVAAAAFLWERRDHYGRLMQSFHAVRGETVQLDPDDERVRLAVEGGRLVDGSAPIDAPAVVAPTVVDPTVDPGAMPPITSSIETLVAWVEGDEERAGRVRDAEMLRPADEQRSTLLTRLGG